MDERDRIQQAINDLVLLKHRFGALGMFRTMQQLEHAVKESGYEFAETRANQTTESDRG